MIHHFIDDISKLRSEMFPAKQPGLNIEEFDHLVATMVEELGELRGAVRSFLGRPYSPEKTATMDHILEEFGDVITPFIGMLDITDISIEEALLAARTKLSHRKAKKAAKINPSNNQ